MNETNALVLEVLRQDNTLSMSIFKQDEFASTLRHYSKLCLSFSEIDRLCQQTVSILNKVDKKGVLDIALIDQLKKIGQLLWDQLLTRSVKDRLRVSQIRDLILSIDEELIYIPWELLYNGQDFLCLRFNLGRVVRTKEQATPPIYRSLSGVPKMLILANPTNDLKSAYLEGVYIKNKFDKKRREINIDFKSNDIDTLYIKKTLRDYDIVHFAGHSEYDSDDPKNSGWLLADGRFTTQDIYKLAETPTLPSIVFSNACYSARVTSGLMDDYQEKTYSIASAFLFSGVKHYIGTIRKIEDPLSLTFAQEFYTQLITGRSVGESVRLSRLRLIREYGVMTVSWASYLLYGDPNFVLFRVKVKLPRPKLKKGISLYRKSLLRLSLAVFIISICIYLYRWLPTINPNTYILFSHAQKLSLKGNNQAIILACNQIIKKDPKFAAVYPLLADTYSRQGDRKTALRYYFEYALTCEKRNDKKNLSSAYIGIGWLYHLQGDYSKAFNFYNKAVTLSQDSNDRLHLAEALRKLAVWYINKEDYDKALELLTKSSEINRERQRIYAHRYNLACDYFDLGLVFINKDDFVTAQEFYAKSRRLFEDLKLKSELSDYYFNLGEVYLSEKQFQQALDCYFKGLAIDKQHDNKPNLTSDYIMLGELYSEMGDPVKAEDFFNQAVSVSQAIDAPLELAEAYYNLGLLYKQKGQKARAREYLSQAQEIYQPIETPDYQKIKQELQAIDTLQR